MQNCRLTYLFTYLLTKIPRCRYNAMFFERPCETIIMMHVVSARFIVRQSANIKAQAAKAGRVVGL